jgi:pectinesterase
MYGSPVAGDVRNGIDVWTKRVRSLIVAKWYMESEGSPPGKDTYHTDRGEGADYFSVGRSLGAGGSGAWLNGTLYQPGIFSSWKTIFNGPLRVCFELTYDSIRAGQSVLSEVRRISLDAGENLNSLSDIFRYAQ